MSVFDNISSPQEIELLVAFFDLTRFLQFSQNHSSKHIFNTLSDYFEFVGDIIEGSGGTIVKFIGDAGLFIFPEAQVNQGVQALLDLKGQGDTWLAEHMVPCRNIIQAHFGPVMCGPLGTRTDKRFDIIGDTVNTAATLKSNGLVISAQVFRKLDTDTRKQFKKHTPPITYIPVNERHKD